MFEGKSSLRRSSSLLDIDTLQKTMEQYDEKTLEVEIHNVEKRYAAHKNKMKKVK